MFDGVGDAVHRDQRHLLRGDVEIVHGDVYSGQNVRQLVGADDGAEVHGQNGAEMFVGV